ncbi:MAG: hypothetical protein H6828_13255 [Planctomycetes bacterium]|nr:hypothetical protein [Planctomycetota bacterium]
MLCHLALLVSLGAPAGESFLVPKLDAVRLAIDDHELAPVASHGGWKPAHVVGEWLVQVGEGRVAWSSPADEEARSVELPGEAQLAWLTSVEDVVLLADPEGSSLVRRLDLELGRWLDAVETDANGEGWTLVSALADRGAVYLYSTQPSEENPFLAASDLGAFRVQRLDPKSGEVRWTFTQASQDRRPGPGVALWAARRPRYEADRTERLTSTSRGVLVCAGGANDPLLLDRESGALVQRIDHPWEYQRSFIGPSIWSHVMLRFGDRGFWIECGSSDPDEVAREQERIAEARKHYEERWTGAVLGGPVVLGSGYEERTFLAIARESTESAVPGYSAEHFLLELDGDGRPLTILPTPRAPEPTMWTRHAGTVVWACAGGAFACVRPARRQEARTSLGGEVLGHLRWYRELERDERKVWLSTDAATDRVVFDATHAYRPAGGGVVRGPRDQVFEFPLWRVSLADGAADVITLRVPFHGTLERPSGNSRSEGGTVYAMGPYAMGLTWLDIVDARLVVQLTTEEGTWGLEFELP